MNALLRLADICAKKETGTSSLRNFSPKGVVKSGLKPGERGKSAQGALLYRRLTGTCGASALTSR